MNNEIDWDGVGLPPVGAVCEYQIAGYQRKVKVVAHVSEYGRKLAVFQNLYEDTWSSSGCLERFRPIRTPEQIAAEERERAVQEMQALDPRNMAIGMMGRTDFCRALYDAGYRKTGEKK